MPKLSLRLFGLIALACASPAAAMNWCAIPQITPQRIGDFDRIVPTVEALTGCVRQPSDSAHSIRWACGDDPATPEVDAEQMIMLLREPGEIGRFMLLGSGQRSFDFLSSCDSSQRMYERTRFAPGNVALIDRFRRGVLGPRYTMTSIDNGEQIFIISETSASSSPTAFEIGAWQGIHGFTAQIYPSTTVRIAGIDPVARPAVDVVRALEARGAQPLPAEGEVRDLFPVWRMTPPTGLAGVREVRVEAMFQHVLEVHYLLSSTADYERFISLLDAEYGASSRTAEGDCTYRWWQSGQIAIRGEHCASSDTLTFYNDVAGDQLDQIAADLERRHNAPRRTDSNTIDRDNF